MLTAPLFLIGLVAVGIPIAIHLLQLRRYRKVYFSNVDMLDALQSQNRKQQNLRRRLILAARILAIVFLVLAFCQPVIPNRHAQMQTGNTVVSVYVDNSYSMECGGVDGSLMESAKAKAREIADAYRPGDLFQLITNDMNGAQFHWLSRQDFLDAVDALQVTSVTTPLSAIASRQNQFLHSATAANRHAYIISDFQCATADIDNYPADSLISVTFLPLGGTQVDNLYIDSLSFDAPAYYPGAAVRAQVTVTNRGSRAVEKLPLRLFVADKQQALATVDVPAHGSASAQMVFTLSSAGAVQGYVETTDYPITFDDRLYFTLTVQGLLPMLVVSGGEENPYIKRLFATDSLVQYHQSAVSSVDYASLPKHTFIVLDQLRNITTGLGTTLSQFLQQGGSLLVIPPADADELSYNQFLASVHAPTLSGWKAKASRAAQVAQSHPLYRGVFQGQNTEVELPEFKGFHSMKLTSSTVAQPVITMADGSPLLVGLPVGSGRMYLMASPFLPQYTNFVSQALFVPTVYNMALFSVPSPMPYHQLSSTDPILLPADFEGVEAPHLLNADGSVDLIPDVRCQGAGWCLLPHGQLVEAGNYRLQPSGAGLSFNYSRLESDLTFYTPDQLRSRLRGVLDGSPQVVASPSKSMTEYIRQHTQGTPLWRWCLLLALGFLLAEILLIRFYRNRNAASQ